MSDGWRGDNGGLKLLPWGLRWGCEGLKWRGGGRRAFCEWAPRLSWPPSPNSGLPGAFVERGWEPRNLAASGWPSSTSLSLPLFSLPFSFLTLLFYILLLLSLSLSLPLLSLACFVPCLIFQCIYFILRPLSLSLLSIVRKGILPLHLSGWNTEGGRKRETKREKKEKLEFSYGIVKETAEGKGKIGF